MGKVISWTLQIIVMALLVKFAIWAYQEFKSDGQGPQQEEVRDIDKICNMDVDIGQCVCSHRETNVRIAVPYDECVSRVRSP